MAANIAATIDANWPSMAVWHHSTPARSAVETIGPFREETCYLLQDRGRELLVVSMTVRRYLFCY